jgi:ABC-2 type transport system ATP-binding protein
MNMSNSIVVSTSGLNKTYKNVVALKSLDLKIAKNSITGLLGPNGAGKTTAIKLLLGLIRQTSGSATVFGLDIVRDSIKIRERIGYLAQNPRYYERMTPRETLQFKARFFYSGPQAEINARADKLLEQVDMSDKANWMIKGLSGGERQRLSIAQALINNPELLILDEPAASLDPMGRRDVLDLMQRLRKETTIMYSTHILDDVQRVSDIVVILNRGELVTEAPVEELLKGTGAIIYAISLKGDASKAHARVSAQPWVSAIDVVSGENQTAWQVTVTDEKAAEAQLLGLIADENTTVTEFGRKKYELEEIFMNIVEGHKKSG